MISLWRAPQATYEAHRDHDAGASTRRHRWEPEPADAGGRYRPVSTSDDSGGPVGAEPGDERSGSIEGHERRHQPSHLTATCPGSGRSSHR